MKVTEITVAKTVKIPVPGQAYSNQESTCHITASIDDGEDVSKAFTTMWETVNSQVLNGLQKAQ